MNEYASFHDLKGTSVFITGGGSGIGAALTEGFVEQGAKVAFVQRSDGAKLCDRIEKDHGSRPLFIKCDITDVAALKDAIAQAADAHGPINTLVSNAANDVRHKTEALSVQDWDANHAVNLRPYFFAAQAVIPGMREQGGGAIVNVSSISFMMCSGEFPAYATANCAIMGLTRALAVEHGGDNIRVNALAPGWVLTEKQVRLWGDPDKLARHLGRQCLNEHLHEIDMVCPVLFMASKASRMMTGQIVPVDGGAVHNSG